MFAVPLAPDADEEAFRLAAKACFAHGLSPADVVFVSPDEPSLIPPLPDSEAETPMFVSRAYAQLLHDAICHGAGDRFALLYDVLWRMMQGQRDLAARASDRAVARLMDYAHSVRRDIHKMHAFLRFKERQVGGCVVFTAWFEPHHHILKRAVPFFCRSVFQHGLADRDPARQRRLARSPTQLRPAVGEARR